RLISATNMALKQMAAEDKFRQDLIYRINTVEIEIPPLRERPEDIPLLADHFLKIYARKYNKKINKLSSQVIKKFNSYPWPGNVREFQHVLERAVIMSDSQNLDENSFHLSAHGSSGDAFDFDSYNLEEIEQTVIEKVMRMHSGNISKAASDLGLTRTSLYRRMEKYGL
ncbi:sigma-54-dependent Fis family transcriptional regulator, partial [bacterium]